MIAHSDITCPGCKGNGYSGGVVPADPEMRGENDVRCEQCGGSGKLETHPCKFCGCVTVVDPSDQSPPLATCDHSGEFE